MVYLRKARAGSCNLGYSWPEDGSVVEVTPEHAALLLAIQDDDFTAVDSAPAGEAQVDLRPFNPEPDSELADTAIEEPTPAAELSEAPAPRRTTKKAAAKRAAEAEAPAPVEE